MNRTKMKNMAFAGIFGAVIFVVTAYMPRLPIIVSAGINGYVHFGDAFIYLAACMLPFPFGLCAASIGASLADVLTGFAIWAPGTLIIKALMSMMFTARSKKILTVRNIIGAVTGGIICVGGYYLYECAIVGSFAVPLTSIPGTSLQAVSNAVLFLAIGFVFDRVKLKSKLEGDIDNDKI